ncbi:PfkB family carbohydrate kinase [Nonomuraea jiangxiensis]|uniref:2-dehydro-3-deoxygluconokinase n=1 Tax=Nonomuraea jiangxiensis TaxID=633440 RepID=A0A1G8S0L8_9ACTN|nr:PfkB family carbohydrate kinase [Nonomuraea jiangxiensis]SDJ22756.1 2-dehydro-3-deoxygluconokinase [Nonomuraea jiangxiensis]
MIQDTTDPVSSEGTPVLVAVGEGLLEVGVRDDLPSDYLGRGFGGDVANVAVMAARMGTRARLLTRLGADTPGRLLLDFWRRAHLDVDRVTVDSSAPTGMYVNAVRHGGHSFGYYRSGSAATRLSPADVDRGLLDDAGALHVSGISLAISSSAALAAERAAELARDRGVTVTFCVNHRLMLRPDTERNLAFARAADIVILSSEDALAMLDTDHPDRIRSALGEGPQEIVLTDGAAGAVVLTGGEIHRVVAPQVVVVDTAGAGDALAGAYLAGRLAGTAPPDALELAVIAGALSCRWPGCARSYPSAEEVVRVRAGASPDVEQQLSSSESA